MSTWDDLLAVTHPGTELDVSAGIGRWLTLRRSIRQEPGSDYMTLTVEFVRGGSDSDPRQQHPIPPTPDREDPTP